MTDRASGFTLIEMVIAFAILGLTLTVLYGAFESALARTRHDAKFSEATLIGQSLLARAGSEWPLVEGMRSGESNGYRYTLAEKIITAPPGQLAYTMPTIQVTASVSWPEFAGTRSVSIATLKLLPPVTS